MSKSQIKNFFKDEFFLKIWPRLGGKKISWALFESQTPINKATMLWNSLTPSINLLFKKISLPLRNDPNETDENYFKRVTSKIYEKNLKLDSIHQKFSIWPSVALETGGANCSLSSQAQGLFLQKLGYKVEFGLPGPMSHAVIFVEDRERDKYYLDPANGTMCKVVGEEEIEGIKTYLIKPEDERIPFRRVPVCSLEESIATTIWNLASLKQDAVNNVESASLVKRFGVERDIPYGDWTLDNLLPTWRKLKQHPVWEQEERESSERIRLTKLR